ncbi:MAG: hypothetical protein Tsb0021_08950 [Chlamydiales bacterium]
MNKIDQFISTHPVEKFQNQDDFKEVLKNLASFDKTKIIEVRQNGDHVWVPVVRKKKWYARWISLFWKPQARRADEVAGFTLAFLEKNQKNLKKLKKENVLTQLSDAHIWSSEQRKRLFEIFHKIKKVNITKDAKIEAEKILKEAEDRAVAVVTEANFKSIKMEEESIKKKNEVEETCKELEKKAAQTYQEKIDQAEQYWERKKSELKDENNNILNELNKTLSESYVLLLKDSQGNLQPITSLSVKEVPYFKAYLENDMQKIPAPSTEKEKYPKAAYVVDLSGFSPEAMKAYTQMKLNLMNFNDVDASLFFELNELADFLQDKEASIELLKYVPKSLESMHVIFSGIGTQVVRREIATSLLKQYPKILLNHAESAMLEPEWIANFLQLEEICHLSETELYKDVQQWVDRHPIGEAFWTTPFGERAVTPLELIRWEHANYNIIENKSLRKKVKKQNPQSRPDRTQGIVVVDENDQGLQWKVRFKLSELRSDKTYPSIPFNGSNITVKCTHTYKGLRKKIKLGIECNDDLGTCTLKRPNKRFGKNDRVKNINKSKIHTMYEWNERHHSKHSISSLEYALVQGFIDLDMEIVKS